MVKVVRQNQGTETRKRGRPPVRRDEIQDELRKLLVAGTYQPGDRLPSRATLQQQFSTGPGTVQQALDELVADGLIYVEPHKGTFVAARPPYRHRYGLVMLEENAGDHGPRISRARAVLKAAKAFSAHEPNTTFVNFAAIQSTRRRADQVRLARELKARRLAGLIHLVPPVALAEDLHMSGDMVPQVALMSEPTPLIPAIAPDRDHFAKLAMRWLHARQRRSIALIHLASAQAHREDARFDPLIKQYGFQTQDSWRLALHASPEWAAERIASLLLCREGRSDSPDALVISDDSLVEPVLRGIAAAGRVPGRDIDIVALVNLPALPRCSGEVRLIGFDAAVILERAFELLEIQKDAPHGHTSLTTIPARDFGFACDQPETHFATPLLDVDGTSRQHQSKPNPESRRT